VCQGTKINGVGACSEDECMKGACGGDSCEEGRVEGTGGGGGACGGDRWWHPKAEE
jgi:hypothetical protein